MLNPNQLNPTYPERQYDVHMKALIMTWKGRKHIVSKKNRKRKYGYTVDNGNGKYFVGPDEFGSHKEANEAAKRKIEQLITVKNDQK